MLISSAATVLTVSDVTASSEFLAKHLGFREQMTAPGFASLQRGEHALRLRVPMVLEEPGGVIG